MSQIKQSKIDICTHKLHLQALNHIIGIFLLLNNLNKHKNRHTNLLKKIQLALKKVNFIDTFSNF